MRPLAIIVAALAFTGTAAAHLERANHVKTLSQRIHYQRHELSHARYVCARGSGEVKRWHCAAAGWIGRELRESLAYRKPVDTVSVTGGGSSVSGIICSVFGAYCSQALAVARCESTLNIYARNGQYLGLFQMGDYARGRYGFAWDAWTQARGAFAYFRAAGWAPWQCRP